jgi:hypothetical protein
MKSLTQDSQSLGPKIEPRTSRLRSRSVNHSTMTVSQGVRGHHITQLGPQGASDYSTAFGLIKNKIIIIISVHTSLSKS